MDPLDGSLFGSDQPCFGCAPNHPIGFRLTFERQDDGVVTTFTPTDQYQGPPGVMHGGLVMALADEIGAWSVIAKTGKFGFTAAFEGKLKKPIRIGTPVIGRGRLLRGNSRVAHCAVTISQGDEVAFEAELRVAVLDEAGAERLLGGPIPEEWKRFSR